MPGETERDDEKPPRCYGHYHAHGIRSVDTARMEKRLRCVADGEHESRFHTKQ